MQPTRHPPRSRHVAGLSADRARDATRTPTQTHLSYASAQTQAAPLPRRMSCLRRVVGVRASHKSAEARRGRTAWAGVRALLLD